MSLVLTEEEIPEEGGKSKKIVMTKFIHCNLQNFEINVFIPPASKASREVAN